MMIVPDNQTAPPLAPPPAKGHATAQGFASFMVEKAAVPPDEENEVAMQATRIVPQGDAAAAAAEPSLPLAKDAGHATGRPRDAKSRHIGAGSVIIPGQSVPAPAGTAVTQADTAAPDTRLGTRQQFPRVAPATDGQASKETGAASRDQSDASTAPWRDAQTPTSAGPTAPTGALAHESDPVSDDWPAARVPANAPGTLTPRSGAGIGPSLPPQAFPSGARGPVITGAGMTGAVPVAAGQPEAATAADRSPAITSVELRPDAASAHRVIDGLPTGDAPPLAARSAADLPAKGPVEAILSRAFPGDYRTGAATLRTGRDSAGGARPSVKASFAPPLPYAAQTVNRIELGAADPAQDLMLSATSEPDDLARPVAGESLPSAFSATTHPLARASASQAMPQLAAAITQAAADGRRSTELVLNPEELGRVTLRLKATKGMLTVSVSAERPETLELLRRNIGTLVRDLQETGYDGAQITFAQDGGGAQDRERRHPASLPVPESAVKDAPDTPPPMRLTLVDRLDIRV